MYPRLWIALMLCTGVLAVGWTGAWAFNPDSGVWLRSEALWRVFGLAAYAAWAALALAAAAAVLWAAGKTIAGLWRLLRRAI